MQRLKVFITKVLFENYASWSEDKISAQQRELANDTKVIWPIQEFNM